MYEEPWSTGSTEVREWIRIATHDNARELADHYVRSIINNVALDAIDADARALMSHHTAVNESLTNVFDEAFWNESMHQLVNGPRFKMALREIKLQDILAGVSPINATRNGVDNTNWVIGKAGQVLGANGVTSVDTLLNFAAAYMGSRKNTWAEFSAELLRHLPMSLVASLAVYNAIELSRDPSDVVGNDPADILKVHALRTYMDKVRAYYHEYMGRLLDFDVPPYPVVTEYIEETAAMLRANMADIDGALYDLVTSAAEHNGIDLCQRPLRDYNSIVRRVKAHALVKSHDVLVDLFDQPVSALVNRIGNVSALFKSARVPTSHTNVVNFLETKFVLEFKGLAGLRSQLREMLWASPARSIYVLAAAAALSDFDTIEVHIHRSKKARHDLTLRHIRLLFKGIRSEIEASQDTEQDLNVEESARTAAKSTMTAKAERKEPDPDGEGEPSTRGRPFQVRLPKSEVATFMTAKASNCKQARKLSAINIARAVYAEFGHDVSVYGHNDCNSFCRAVAEYIGEVPISEVLSHAAAYSELSCDLDFDQLHTILRAVPLVVACSVYVADLLGVKLGAIDATNKNLKENDEATKSAIFISYVVNADFSELAFVDAQIVDDIIEYIGAEVWPWSEDGVADHSEPSPAPSCVDMDPADMALKDLIAYVNHFKLLSEEEVATTAESDLRQLVDDHQDELAAEEDEDEE